MKIFIDFPKKYNQKSCLERICGIIILIYIMIFHKEGLYELPGNPLFRAAC